MRFACPLTLQAVAIYGLLAVSSALLHSLSDANNEPGSHNIVHADAKFGWKRRLWLRFL